MFNKPVVMLKTSEEISTLINKIMTMADRMIDDERRLAIGCDTETTGLSPLTSDVRLLQIYFEDVVYILDCFETERQLINKFKPIMESEKIIKVFQNAKFDIKMLKYHFDWNLESIFDTMIAAKLVTNGKKKFKHKYGLDDLCETWLEVTLDKSQQLSDWSGHLSED